MPARASCLVLCLLAACADESAPAAEVPRTDTPARSVSPSATAVTSGGARSSVKSSVQPGAQREVKATVGFVGDLALTMYIGETLEELHAGRAPSVAPDFPFTHVAERLGAYDHLIGNLECVLSKKGDIETQHAPFRCPRAAVTALKRGGFDLVSVANNHALDFGQRGFQDMLKNLDADGMPHFGAEAFSKKRQAPVITVLAGKRVGFLAYYWPPKPPLHDVIEARKNVDILMVFNHWGQDDRVEPMMLQRRLARHFIDAGVDVVVGTHSHVVQPFEWYKGKLVAYGLGNFVFDGMNDTEVHSIGAVLEVDVTSQGVSGHRLQRIRLGDDGVPRWIGDPSATVDLVPQATKPLPGAAAPVP